MASCRSSGLVVSPNLERMVGKKLPAAKLPTTTAIIRCMEVVASVSIRSASNPESLEKMIMGLRPYLSVSIPNGIMRIRLIILPIVPMRFSSKMLTFRVLNSKGVLLHRVSNLTIGESVVTCIFSGGLYSSLYETLGHPPYIF